jgi:hypothetical protein
MVHVDFSRFSPDAARRQAARFSTARFQERLRKAVEELTVARA